MALAVLILCVAMLALGRVGDLPALNVGIKVANLTVSDLLVGSLIVVYAAHCLVRNRLPFAFCRHWRALWILITWAVFSLGFNIARFGLSAREGAFSAAYLLRWIAYSIIYAAACEFAGDRRQSERLIRVMIGSAVAFAIFGIIQAIYLPNFAFILNPQAVPGVDFDMQGHRLVSTFLDPNLACAFLSAGALVALALFLQSSRRWLAPAVVLVLAALFTLSRGGILGLAVGGGLLFLGSKFARRRLGVSVILAAVILLASLPWWLPIALKRDRFSLADQSAQSRFHDWAFAGSVVERYPLVGVGFNTFGFVAARFGRAANGNSAFGVAGDLFLIPMLTGLPGCALYFLLAGASLRSGSRLLGSGDAWERGIGSGVRSATLAAIISSLFTSVLLYPPTAAMLWLFWAVLERAEGSYRERLARRAQTASAMPAVEPWLPVIDPLPAR